MIPVDIFARLRRSTADIFLGAVFFQPILSRMGLAVACPLGAIHSDHPISPPANAGDWCPSARPSQAANLAGHQLSRIQITRPTVRNAKSVGLASREARCGGVATHRSVSHSANGVHAPPDTRALCLLRSVENHPKCPTSWSPDGRRSLGQRFIIKNVIM